MKKPTIGVIQFPGSNCDSDCVQALSYFDTVSAELVWHQSTDLSAYAGIVVPGGFSYGDYLRSGAMAAMSPIIKSLKTYAQKKPVLGICNGFQILVEAGLLPGTLLRNDKQKFVCRWVELEGSSQSTWTTNAQKLDCHIPVAHGEGRYYIDQDGLKRIQDNEQIVLRYKDNPNGSVESIAGVANKQGNILGMMPHPERAMDIDIHGSASGRLVWESFLEKCL